MEPITRSEQYLASIIGEDVVLPVPQSRIEHYLNLIAQNGISPSSAGLISYDPDADYPDGSLGAGMKAEAAEVADLKSAIGDGGENILAAYPTDTASGAVASFPDGAAVPVKSLVVNIDPAQSGSGDPAPDNVRPISGWTGVTISHSGEDTSDPEIITISWQSEAGTVYGGTLDVTTGVLTVTHTYETIDGDEPWALSGSNFRFALQPSNGFPTKAYGQKNVICDRYAATGTNSNRYVGITNSGLSTVDEFKAALAADHAHLCYELSNPQTYQLTPTEVSTLLGANNIWADTGDVSVNYRADTTLYIDKLTSSTEEDMIADAPIASGKYFLVGNRLFLSTASIAAGATLTPGTNCTETNLAAALNALNS